MRRRVSFWRTARIGLDIIFFIVCAFSCFCVRASAVNPVDYSITILSADASEINYSVSSPVSGMQAIAITATYRLGQMMEAHVDPFITKEESHTGSATLSIPYDDFKVILLDGTTYSPLCHSGGEQTVRFLNSNGALISEQQVFSGHSALPPEAPTKNGFLFMGWSADYSTVFEDMILTPCFAELNDDNLFIFTSSSDYVEAGEEVTVCLQLLGTVELCGFDLRLLYDGETLELLDMDSDKAFDITANHVLAGNYIRLNFSSRENKNKGGDIIEVTFRVKNAGKAYTRIGLNPVAVIGVNPDDGSSLCNVEYAMSEGVIWIR